MSDVFISYSRKDKPFVQVLHQALAASYYEAWIDWEDIPLTADWWAEIEAGIEAADTFLFVISPDSIVSQICGQEIDHAVSHQKRLVPIVRRDGFDAAILHPALGKHNWLFFRETDDFDVAFAALVMALNTDLAYVKAHTRLLVKALDWERKQRRDDLLLRGEDLSEAERWLDQSLQTGHDPPPTEQHNIYIHKSREVETANQRLTAAGEKAKRMVRLGSGVLAGTLALASVIGVLTVQAFRGLREAKIATRIQQDSTYALEKFASTPLDALLIAMEQGRELEDLVGNRPLEEYPTTQPLVTLRTILDNIQEKNQIKAHDSSIWAMDVNPVHELVATADEFGHVRVWDFAGKLQFETTLEIPRYVQPFFSRDGHYLLVGGGKNQLKLWDVNTWQTIMKTGIPPDQVSQVAILPSGSWVSASTEGALTFWDQVGEPRNTVQITPYLPKNSTGLGIRYDWNAIENAIEIIYVLKNSPAQEQGLKSGDFILKINNIPISVENRTQSITLLSAETIALQVARQNTKFDITLQPNTFLTEQPISILSLQVSPKETWVAVGCRDGKVHFWPLTRDSTPPDISAHPTAVYDLAVSPDSTLIATVGDEAAVKLWNLTTGELVATLEGDGFGLSVAFSPDGRYITASSSDGISRLWSLDGQLLGTFQGHSNSVTQIAFGHHHDLILTAGRDGTLRFWPLTWMQDSSLEMSDFYDAELSPDGQYLATGDWDDNSAILWSLTGERLAQMDHQDSEARVMGIAFSPDGQILASTTARGRVHLWNLDGEEILNFMGSGSIVEVVFSPDGQTLLTTSVDSVVGAPTVGLWNLQGQLLTELKGHQDAIWSGRFSPDGQHILTGSNDGTARLWTINGELIKILRGSANPVMAVAFSQNGQTLATAEADGLVRLWNLEGEELYQLRGHQKGVRSISFHPNGEYLVTASLDKTARIWNLEGQQIAEFRDVKGGGGFAQFSPDGQQVILIGQHNQVHIVPFSPASLDELLQRGCDWLADYLTHSPSATEAQRALCPGIGVEGTEQ